jgi:serine/threonine protein kinase
MVIYMGYGRSFQSSAYNSSHDQANIFINAEGHAQLADFGLSIVGETAIGKMSSASNAGGNIRYLAPERIDPTSQDMRPSTACDVYAFACVCLFVSSTLHCDLLCILLMLVTSFTPVNIHSTSARYHTLSSLMS